MATCYKNRTNKKYAKEYQHTSVDGYQHYKFKLNIPQMELICKYDYIWYYYPKDETTKYLSPFPNTDQQGCICLGYKNTKTYQDALNAIYNTIFLYCPHKLLSAYKYHTLHDPNSFLDFYQNWQNTGKLELIPV